MDQVCDAKAYTKQGVFRKQYAKMKKTTSPEFDAIVTEGDAANKRSFEAHYAIDFKTLSRYQGDGRDWVLIYLM
jgi:hypothetical protein